MAARVNCKAWSAMFASMNRRVERGQCRTDSIACEIGLLGCRSGTTLSVRMQWWVVVQVEVETVVRMGT